MSVTRTRIMAAAMAVALVVLVGCGRGEDRTPVPPNPTSTPRPTATALPTATPTVIPTSTPAPTPTPTPSPTPTPTPLAPDAAFLAIFDLADRLGVGPNTISVSSYEEDSWPSSAYGCPSPGTIYLPAEVNGWRVILEADGETYEYHTDSSGSVIVNCSESRSLDQQLINVVELADLRSATSIEMRRRVGSGEFVLKATVTNPGEIDAILDTLDVPVLPGPAASCTEVFRLVFATPGGNQVIGTICGGNSRLIRGDQSFWAGQDAEAPAEFNAIIGPYFADDPIPNLPE